MKRLLFILVSCGILTATAQTYIPIAGDPQGDDHFADAKELSYYLNNTSDTLFIKIEHYNQRSGDFGYAIILDTNLNTNDGFAIAQGSLKNQSPNTSMNYDVALYAYQNGFFPTVYTEAYGSNGSPTTLPFDFDTTDLYFGVFSIPLSSIGGNVNVNMIAFTGSFDISPSGGGPGDALPDATYSELRTNTLSIQNHNLPRVEVYPNPAMAIVNISAPSYIQALELVNIKGQRVSVIDLTKNNTMDVSSLPEGNYFLRDLKGRLQVKKIQIKK
jgi:hypothetical protein